MTRYVKARVLSNLPAANLYRRPLCNSTVHGSDWVANAAGKLAGFGYSTRFKPEGNRTFEGFQQGYGNLGSRTIPFSILGVEGDARGVPGVLDSHEIKGSAPLLLSLYAQAQLGIATDLRTSSCGIRLPSDDTLIKVQLCRTHDSPSWSAVDITARTYSAFL